MKKQIVLVCLAILLIGLTACSVQEDSFTDTMPQEQQTDNQQVDEVVDAGEQDLLTDDDFVEIGEMI